MKLLRLSLALGALLTHQLSNPASVLAQPSPDGCWLGTMGEGATRRRLLFEIHSTERGTAGGMAHLFTGTVQSHEMADLVVAGKTLAFVIANVPGDPRFSGEISATSIRGSISQNDRVLPVTLQRVAGADVDGLSLVGNWSGSLEQNGTPLMRLVIRFAQVACGQVAATMDSPDQGAMDMPATDLTVRADSLLFGLTYLNGRYAGRLNSSDDIEGTWTQNGVEMVLNLERHEGEAPSRRRPQEPEAPFPYDEEEVTYVNAQAGVTLAGTLTTPQGNGPFPAVLMLSGSGAQDRDEALVGHRPFFVIADHLTRQGIAVLRVDDRGVGGSTGSTIQSTLLDSAEDALAGIAYLKSRPAIDARRIGLVGHSEGGWVAPIVATRSGDVAFIVMLAGPGISGEELLVSQGIELNLAAGSSRPFAEGAALVGRHLYETLRNEPDDAAANTKLLDVAHGSRDELLAAATTATDSALTIQWIESFDQQTAILTTPWFRHLLTYDPRPTLEQVRVPVLALFGALDLQVPPQPNKSALEAAFEAGGNTAVTIRVLENLNHLFQTATTGRMEEYALIEETFSPDALSMISTWILEHTH